MADKLLPCPFCGGEAEYSMIDSSSVIPFGIINHFVTCKNHCLEGLYSRGNTKEEAIEAWNNRPSPWHTGTPTEDGWYLVAYRKRDCDGSFYWDYGTRVWEDYGEYGHWNITSMKYPVIKWQKIDDN